MKLIYIFIILLSTNAFAEDNMISNLNYRPVLGLTYSNLSYGDDYKSANEPSFDDSSEASFLLGFLIELSHGNFKFNSGIQYTSYKSEVSGTTGKGVFAPDTVQLDVSHKLDYLQVPLNASYYISEMGKGFHIQSGLAPSFLVKAKRTFKFSSPIYIYNGPKLEDEIKNFDLIASIGLGYSFGVLNHIYDVSLNYHKGLIEVDDSSRDESATNSSFVLQLSFIL